MGCGGSRKVVRRSFFKKSFHPKIAKTAKMKTVLNFWKSVTDGHTQQSIAAEQQRQSSRPNNVWLGLSRVLLRNICCFQVPSNV